MNKEILIISKMMRRGVASYILEKKIFLLVKYIQGVYDKVAHFECK